jgi:hypothetical protein
MKNFSRPIHYFYEYCGQCYRQTERQRGHISLRRDITTNRSVINTNIKTNRNVINNDLFGCEDRYVKLAAALVPTICLKNHFDGFT